MFRFLVLKPLVFEECLVSWFQTSFLQILRVRLGFAVNCSAPFCSFLMNVSSPGADLVFLPFGFVLRFDECLGSWPQFCSFLMNVSSPGANSASAWASAWATPGRPLGLHLDRGRLRVVRRVHRLEQLPEKRALGQDLHGVQQPGRLG